MKNKIYMVDTFTDVPFTGNPACVCILSEDRDDKWMQSFAFEMNLSETAFIILKEEEVFLRWFTPKTEIELCGHATLASAHVLWETRLVDPEKPIAFNTKSGVLSVKKIGPLIEMDFPIHRHQIADFSLDLLSAFQISPIYVGTFDGRVLVEVENEDMVKAIEPDFNKLKKLNTRGVVITSVSASDDIDFVSRYFAPWDGVDEDPVTGATHCCLGPYWARKLEKKELRAYQASSRGGYINMRIERDKVFLAGNAVTIYEGRIIV